MTWNQGPLSATLPLPGCGRTSHDRASDAVLSFTVLTYPAMMVGGARSRRPSGYFARRAFSTLATCPSVRERFAPLRELHRSHVVVDPQPLARSYLTQLRSRSQKRKRSDKTALRDGFCAVVIVPKFALSCCPDIV